MELRINCDASVKLKKINGTKSVSCKVIDYKLKKDTLNGNILINGKYIKDELDKDFEFSELVPFTVVFKDDNIDVTDIRVENFNNTDVVNQSVDCHFDIVVSYNEKKSMELDNGIEMKETEEIDPVEIIDDIDVDDVGDDIDLDDVDLIENKYDEMLQDILTRRNDNFLEQSKKDYLEEELVEEPEVEIIQKPNLSINLSKGIDNSKQPVFKEMKETFQSYSIYFINNDSDIDKICKNENLNINDVYEDYTKNRRIIVK